MTTDTWPRRLEPVTGPYPTAKVQGVVGGMGEHGPSTVALIESGRLPPDLMTGMTLYLLACQPRNPRPRPSSTRSGKTSGAPGVSGRIWVREQSTFHRPVAIEDAFVIDGESAGRHIRKGRRYATTSSVTRNSEGQLVSTNLTTGLLGYRVDASLEDGVEGRALEDIPSPEPDQQVAAHNPHLDRLADAKEGQVLGEDRLRVTLAMMAARDTENPMNPIHSDPESARAAGLRKPIAGGSHVQAFALELLMAAWGPEVLLHGATIDTRWKVPTEADTEIMRRAEVVAVHADRVEVAFEARVLGDDAATGDSSAGGASFAGGALAMAGSIVIPRPA